MQAEKVIVCILRKEQETREKTINSSAMYLSIHINVFMQQ